MPRAEHYAHLTEQEQYRAAVQFKTVSCLLWFHRSISLEGNTRTLTRA